MGRKEKAGRALSSEGRAKEKAENGRRFRAVIKSTPI